MWQERGERRESRGQQAASTEAFEIVPVVDVIGGLV